LTKVEAGGVFHQTVAGGVGRMGVFGRQTAARGGDFDGTEEDSFRPFAEAGQERGAAGEENFFCAVAVDSRFDEGVEQGDDFFGAAFDYFMKEVVVDLFVGGAEVVAVEYDVAAVQVAV